MLNKLNSKKGFTIIELIVVIAVLGILILLAAPKFLGYLEKSEITNIQNDTKVLENIVTLEIANDKYVEENELVKVNSLLDLAYEGKLFNSKGQVTNIDGKGKKETYSKVSDEILKDSGTKLDGTFYLGSGGTVYYEHNKPLGEIPNEMFYVAQDSDFEGTSDGDFRYIGESLEVYIPNVIKGVAVTSYNRMFEYTPVTKVMSNNHNITNMDSMFRVTTADNIDVSRIDTSNVTTMYDMFADSEMTSIDVSNFDTSKVTNMLGMFAAIKVDKIDVSNFDTSKVANMNWMFTITNADTLDLSNFDMSNVVNTDNMFYDSKATKGYARTEADAAKLNASSEKPEELVFVVKR